MPTHVHRAWLATLAATALLAGGPAAAQGGEGSALISPSKALVRSTGTWRLVYTVGASGVAPGGGLRVHASGFPRRVFESPQTGNPTTSGYAHRMAMGSLFLSIGEQVVWPRWKRTWTCCS